MRNLQRVETLPYILDTVTLDRLTQVYTTPHGDLCLYEEQLARWRTQVPTTSQRTEIARQEQCLTRLHTCIAAILERAQRMQGWSPWTRGLMASWQCQMLRLGWTCFWGSGSRPLTHADVLRSHR